MNFLKKYPKTNDLLNKTGMSLDEALLWTELEMKKQGKI